MVPVSADLLSPGLAPVTELLIIDRFNNDGTVRNQQYIQFSMAPSDNATGTTVFLSNASGVYDVATVGGSAAYNATTEQIDVVAPHTSAFVGASDSTNSSPSPSPSPSPGTNSTDSPADEDSSAWGLLAMLALPFACCVAVPLMVCANKAHGADGADDSDLEPPSPGPGGSAEHAVACAPTPSVVPEASSTGGVPSGDPPAGPDAQDPSGPAAPDPPPHPTTAPAAQPFDTPVYQSPLI